MTRLAVRLSTLGLAATALGAVGPWYTVRAEAGELTLYGPAQGGWLVLALAAIGARALTRRRRGGLCILAVLAGLFSLWFLWDMDVVLDQHGGYQVTAQWGLMLAVLGPIVLFLAAWLAKPEMWRVTSASHGAVLLILGVVSTVVG